MQKKGHSGQGLAEYTMIILLIVVSAILMSRIFGISVYDVYCRVVSVLSPNACSGALCSDKFVNLSGEQGVNGPWRTSNGTACINGGGYMLNSCSQTQLNTNNYTIQASNAQLSSGMGYGIFFRASNSGLGINGYAFQYDPGLSGFVIRKWINGIEVNPALVYKSVSGFDWYGAPHNLSVKVSGNTFTGYVDGVAMVTATDNSYPTGGGGIRTWDATNLCLSEFKITP